MNIGPPLRIVEIEPVTLPVPEAPPDPGPAVEPEPAEVPEQTRG